jgi:hypothetical protein
MSESQEQRPEDESEVPASTSLMKLYRLEDIVRAGARKVHTRVVAGVGIFFLMEMSAREREMFVEYFFGTDKDTTVPPDRWSIANLAAGLCDQEGLRLWRLGEGDDRPTFDVVFKTMIEDFSPAIARELAPFAANLHGFGGNKDGETLAKNSDGAPAISS